MNQVQVFIDGLGIISRCAASAADLEALAKGSDVVMQSMPLEFTSGVPAAKMRRNSRYNKMACAAADQALKDSIDYETVEGHRIGTMISTGYGAAELSSEFADSVVKGNPSACSPSVFSGSVPNSCVGQICIVNGLKGPSTVLAGGDPLEYAALLLKTGRADRMLAGSVEEYFPPLYASVASFEAASGCELSEGAAMMVLRSDRTEHTYCEISGFSGGTLSKNPYLHKFEGAEQILTDILKNIETPEVIFSAANGTWFDEEEARAIGRVFPGIEVQTPKKLFGESLGSGYMMSIALAAAGIRCGQYTSVLVTGTDMIGNYCCTLLKK